MTSPTGLDGSAVAKGTVRVVTPGERVEVRSGIKIWLTEDGGHWISPSTVGSLFVSVKNGKVDLSEPGVSVQQEGPTTARTSSPASTTATPTRPGSRSKPPRPK